MIKRELLGVYTQTQQMAWHVSAYTLSRRDREVWESTSLPPSLLYSKSSVCRFTQTNTPYVSRPVCSFRYFHRADTFLIFLWCSEARLKIQHSLWPWHHFIDLWPTLTLREDRRRVWSYKTLEENVTVAWDLQCVSGEEIIRERALMVYMKSKSTFTFVLQMKFSLHRNRFLSHLKVTFFFSQRESHAIYYSSHLEPLKNFFN